jgi:hypothetical protein
VSSAAVVVACVACGGAYDPSAGAPVEAGGVDAAAAEVGADAASVLATDAEAGADDAGTGGVDAAVDLMPDRYRVFVTSTRYTGALGGLVGADAKCAALALAKGLNGVYRAWLSTSQLDAYNRISGGGPWYRIDGKTVVFLTRVTLASGPLVPVLLDENGTLPVGDPSVWTGTSSNGTGSAATCDDWSSASATGTAGRSDKGGAEWTQVSGPDRNCISPARLVCLRAY